jgi:hypothetical protein
MAVKGNLFESIRKASSSLKRDGTEMCFLVSTMSVAQNHQTNYEQVARTTLIPTENFRANVEVFGQ